MSKVKTHSFDIAEHLDSVEMMAAYLEAALEEGDAKVVAAALGHIARAKSMSKIAKDTGLARESLYRSLSSNGNHELGTVMKVAESLGLKLSVTPIQIQQ